MGESIFLQGLVTVFLGTNGSRAQESGQRSSQRQWLMGLDKGESGTKSLGSGLSLRRTEPMVDIGIMDKCASVEDGTTGRGTGVKGDKVGIGRMAEISGRQRQAGA